MKNKSKISDAPFVQKTFGVSYRWTGSDGTICSGHTVSTGRDRAHAERRFFRQHRHVEQEQTEGAEV